MRLRVAALALAVGVVAGPARAGPGARVSGRVFERGSISPLAGVRVWASSGASATTDAAGRFELELPAATVELQLESDGHDPLRVIERLRPGERRRAEYRLSPRAARYETIVAGAQAHAAERVALSGE